MSVHDTGKITQVKELLGIPADEPIFILRAQDKLTYPTLTRYMNYADAIEDSDERPLVDWYTRLANDVSQFAEFAATKPERMKLPD